MFVLLNVIEDKQLVGEIHFPFQYFMLTFT